MAVVLLPTPPFWFTIATTVATVGILARLANRLPLPPFSFRPPKAVFLLSLSAWGTGARFPRPYRRSLYFALSLEMARGTLPPSLHAIVALALLRRPHP